MKEIEGEESKGGRASQNMSGRGGAGFRSTWTPPTCAASLAESVLQVRGPVVLGAHLPEGCSEAQAAADASEA